MAGCCDPCITHLLSGDRQLDATVPHCVPQNVDVGIEAGGFDGTVGELCAYVVEVAQDVVSCLGSGIVSIPIEHSNVRKAINDDCIVKLNATICMTERRQSVQSEAQEQER
jgi:hypothetical protein